MDYEKFEFETISHRYKILNKNYKIVYDSSRRNKWGSEVYVEMKVNFCIRVTDQVVLRISKNYGKHTL